MVEVRIRLHGAGDGQAELLRCVLVGSGIPLEKIAEKDEKGRRSLSIFPDSLQQARLAAGAIRRLGLKGVAFSIIPLKDSDWKTRWKKYFKPFNITRDLRIIPVWEKRLSAPRGTAGIRLDTTLAFGTGLHATTRMMAGFIRGRKPLTGSFLDIGTGSGILSLAACRYGAREIWALDNDAEAVKTARRNFRANGCSDAHLSAEAFAAFAPGRRFDFVAANLFTEDLVRFRRKLAALVEPGGVCAVSGIFIDNYPSFRRRFKVSGMTVEKTLKRNKWYAVLFRKAGRGKR